MESLNDKAPDTEVITPKSAMTASATELMVLSCPAPVPDTIRIVCPTIPARLNPAMVIVVDVAAIASPRNPPKVRVYFIDIGEVTAAGAVANCCHESAWVS